jgi:hypothetical protein
VKKLFVYGTRDVEQERSLALAEEAGYVCTTGLYEGRPPRHGGEAYQVQTFLWEIVWQDWDEVVRFECDGPAFQSLSYRQLVVIDHHRPGDPGYDAPPERFWEGSSLGQLCCHLELPPTERDLWIAAADHCLGAAYAGLCPGVDPQRLRAFRLAQRCSFYRLRDCEAEYYWRLCEQILAKAPRLSWAGEEIADLRQVDIPWNANLLCDVAGWKRTAVVFYKHRGGRSKLRLGCTAPATVEYFLKKVVPSLELEDPYGVPQRGFAGAYYPVETVDNPRRLLKRLRGRWRLQGQDFCAALERPL